MSENEIPDLVEGMTAIQAALEANHAEANPAAEFSVLAAKRKAAQARLEELQRNSQEPAARAGARPAWIGKPGS